MAVTDVSVFLAPSGGDIYREVHPYGPNYGVASTGFYNDLEIEVAASAIPTSPVLAVVDGLIRVVETGGNTCSIVLKPTPEVLKALPVGGSIVFTYRNLDKGAVTLAAEKLLFAPERKRPVEVTLGDFLDGNYPVAIKSGETLGRVSAPMAGLPATIGFAIVFVPSGSAELSEDAFTRLKDYVRPDATTRRLDPATFYGRIARSTSDRVRIAPAHHGHPLFAQLTKRILLEVRNENDEDIGGSISVTLAADGSTADYRAAWDRRGTVVIPPIGPLRLPVPLPFNGLWPALLELPLPGSDTARLTVRVAGHVLTKLPSGGLAYPEFSHTLVEPEHLALQALLLDGWLAQSSLQPATEKNHVDVLVDGAETFGAMVHSMLTISDSTHSLRLAGWWLSDDFLMVPGQEGTTFAALTQQMALRGASVHALLWDQWGRQNDAEVDHINALHDVGGVPIGHAILDKDTLTLGSHHQKILIIAGAAGKVAYCGGVDINPDRLDDRQHKAASPFHDVHAKVRGPAVDDLDRIFTERWNEHPRVQMGEHPPITILPRPDANPGTHYVQVTRTVPPKKRYPFAPSGDLGTLRTVLKAIGRAREFIYIEDQYLFPFSGTVGAVAQDKLGILKALQQALQRIRFLLIVLPNHTTVPQDRVRRRNLITTLKQDYNDKVFVYYMKRAARGKSTQPPRDSQTAIAEYRMMTAGVPTLSDAELAGIINPSGGKKYPDEIYVHSKVWVIDDVYAKIGSCNVNRRGLTHDSEADIHVLDGALTNGRRRFALELRKKLWGEHLGLLPQLLEDPHAALTYWKDLRERSERVHVAPYLEDQEVLFRNDLSWDHAIDPDGDGDYS